MDMRVRWAEIRAEAAGIPDTEVYVVSKSRRDKFVQAGRVFGVKRLVAARLIVEDTHELASEAEIEAYNAADKKEGERIRKEAFAEKQKFQVNIDAASLFRLAKSQAPDEADPTSVA